MPDKAEDEEDTISEIERKAINYLCQQALDAWKREKEPCEPVDLLRRLNLASAKAIGEIRKLKKRETD